MTKRVDPHEQQRPDSPTEHLTRVIGGSAAHDARPDSAQLDKQPPTKVQRIINLIYAGKDTQVEAILRNDFAEEFSPEEVDAFFTAVEVQYASGFPMNFHRFFDTLKEWGVPVLQLTDEHVSKDNEVEHYTEVLDEALDFLKDENLVSKLQNGEIDRVVGGDIIFDSALGWTGDEDDSLRNFEILVAFADPDEHSLETSIEEDGDKTSIKNAVVSISFGYDDTCGPTTRATYVADISIDKTGQLSRFGKPSYVSSQDKPQSVTDTLDQ